MHLPLIERLDLRKPRVRVKAYSVEWHEKREAYRHRSWQSLLEMSEYNASLYRQWPSGALNYNSPFSSTVASPHP
jgi:hypothetical protein